MDSAEALVLFIKHQRTIVDVRVPVLIITAPADSFGSVCIRCELLLLLPAALLNERPVSAFAVFYYDFLITFHLEIQLVWRSAWSYTKILFLLSRYIVFVVGYFVLHGEHS